MFPAERLEKIKKIITQKEQVDVSTLSDMLKVTEVTVRRDLEKLENEGFLTRTHGGAILNDKVLLNEQLSSYSNDEIENIESKKIIAKIASYFVSNNDIVFLGAGSVNRFIARSLNDKKNLTVMTNDMTVALDLASYSPNVKILLCGGELNPINKQLFGRMAENSIKSLFFNVAFINVDGVSFERGYTLNDLDKAYFTTDIMSISQKSIAVCDYTKFNKNDSVHLGPLTMFKTLISNEHTPEKYKEFFFKNEIQFFCTFDVYRR